MNFTNKIFLAFILLSSICYSQSIHKEDYKIYQLAFERLQSKVSDTLVIEISPNPTNLMVEDLRLSKTLTTKELRKVELQTQDEYTLSDHIKNLLLDISKASPDCREDDSYTKRLYSRPFYISENEAIIFLSFAIKNKKYEGGKGIGSNIVEFYKNDGQSWFFEKSERLSAF